MVSVSMGTWEVNEVAHFLVLGLDGFGVEEFGILTDVGFVESSGSLAGCLLLQLFAFNNLFGL